MPEGIAVGRVGWCRITSKDPMLQVKVRFAETATGRLAIAEAVVARWPGVTSDDFRSIRFGRVESWANGPGRDALRAALADRVKRSGKAVAEIDADERAEADARAGWNTSPEAVAAQVAARAMAERLGVADRLDRGEVAIGEGGTVSEAPLRRRVRSLRLRVPTKQPIPDRFYKELARIYSDLALSEAGPAKAIAEENGVKVSRVHGWVAEARRRGFLAPGERQARSSR